MAEYIEREKIFSIWKSIPAPASVVSLSAAIHQTPAAEVAEVRHGRWEFPVFTDDEDGLDPRVKCSECGGIEAAFARWKYCPNCGACMDKEDKHDKHPSDPV